MHHCIRLHFTLGSPEINGNIFFIMNMYIHVCIIYACVMNCTQSPTVLITHGQPCDTSCKHYTYNILRLASKFLNCTRSLQNIAQKINKYATKHEINTIKVSSDNFTNLQNFTKNSQCFSIFC